MFDDTPPTTAFKKQLTMAKDTWNYFTLLMWKNSLIKFRHKLELFIEIFVPIAFSCMLIAIRGIKYPEKINEVTLFAPNYINYLDQLLPYLKEGSIKLWEIDYTPKHPRIERLVDEGISLLASSKPGSRGLDTPEDLERFLLANRSICGIVFHVTKEELDKDYPKDLKFSIRFPGGLRTGRTFGRTTTWMTKSLFPMRFTQGPRNKKKQDGGTPPGYIPEGFIAIQNIISQAYVRILSKEDSPSIPNVLLQRFPYKPYVDDPIIVAMEVMVAFIILLSFVYPCIQAVKHVTTEKETQLKEAMKIMGLTTALHWLAWFFTLWFTLIITVILIVAMIKVPWFDGFSVGVLTHTSASLLFVFFLIYTMGLITFSFMVSSFFSKANVAGAIGGLAWFACYIPYSFTIFNFMFMPLGSKLGLSVFFNTAMAFGFKMILNWEAAGVGAQWDNVFETVTIEENLSLGDIMLMMVADSILYMLITLYVEKIMPGSYGRLYKWYFPLMPSFWCRSKKNYVEDSTTVLNDTNKFEPEIGCGKAGVRLLNLRKMFGNKVAVDGMTLNMYRDQITVLLGHNGAGKTTTISMITGLLSPTSGTAIVNDIDILKDMEEVRKSFGFCPQYNILFDELTVKEHIIFYSKLKGLDSKEIEEEIDKYLRILNFEDKRNALAKTLSGGMKRKLSVGVALCGRSKVVLCDEPSSGMDPAARRSLWDLILEEKKGRTILLTTHFMDEADVLGDRIAIMSGGKLQCSGTPFFLKKRFGTGYQLICSKQVDCKTEHVTTLIKKYIPDIQVKGDVGTELSYDLSEKYAYLFERLLKDLEDSREELKIDGYGISMTTLEDVFMKTGSDLNESASANGETGSASSDGVIGFKEKESTVIVDPNTETIDVVRGSTRMRYQWQAMILKKLYSFKHSWYIFLIQLLIPLFLTIISIYIPKMEESKDLPSMAINLDGYGNSVTLLEKIDSSDVATSYETMFKSFSASKKLDLIKGMNMIDRIINEQEKDLLRVNTRFLAAASIHSNISIGWFNNEALHTAPLALNLLYNAIAKARLGSDHSIEVTNDPLPFSIDIKLDQLELTGSLGFQMALNITFAMAFVSGIFIMYMIKERVSRSKLLQFVSGVRLLTFWFVHLIWDFFAFVIIAAALTILLLIYQPEGFATDKELGRIFLLFVVYGFSSLPLMYLISLFYEDPATGMSRLVMIHVFTGNALYITAFILSSPILGTDGNEGEIIKLIGNIFPSFTLAQGLSNQAKLGTIENICQEASDLLNMSVNALCNMNLIPDCCDLDPFSWSEPGISQVLVAMSVVGVILFLVLLLAESRSYFTGTFKMMRGIQNLPPLSEEGFIDSDVQEEKTRVNQITDRGVPNQNLVMRGVTKYYKKLLAVNQLSVIIDKGECFGLLGVNGAGKTSTFKMLTGDETISHGNIWVKGHDNEADRFTVYEMIGYCPQFDGLLEDLTGKETLRIFSLLRGIPIHMIDSLIKRIAKDLAFDKHLNKSAKDYSGGNRRKLSTAIAILGNPYVIYLDEPTTGIDPASRRKLWDMVCHIRDIGKAIVLTSHSMEECEALCTRIAIMVNGEFKCLGSTQHLKNKFAQGISLTIKLESLPEANGFQPGHSRAPSTTITAPGFQLNEYGQRVQLFINRHFHGATLKDCHRHYLTFEVPINVMPYSRIFGLMEANKEALHIEDYSLCQATLEQIFLNFAQKQRTEEENKMLRKRKKKAYVE